MGMENPELSAITERAAKEMEARGLMLGPEEAAKAIEKAVSGPEIEKLEGALRFFEEQAAAFMKDFEGRFYAGEPLTSEESQKLMDMVRAWLEAARGTREKLAAIREQTMSLKKTLLAGERETSTDKPIEPEEKTLH